MFPGANDYVSSYLPRWAACTSTPLTTGSQSGTTCQQIKIYGSAVWNHWLATRPDRNVIRRAWEGSQASGSFAPAAYGNAISPSGGTASFSSEFATFSASVAEWRAPGSVYPDSGCGGYPDVERASTLSIDGPAQSVTLDHTTFRLLNIPVDASKAQAHLTATLPAGLNGAIAVVGRTGTNPGAGVVTTALRKLPSGGTGEVTLENPGQYGRITAVLVNASAQQTGYNQATEDYIWNQDAQAFSSRVTSTAGRDSGEVTTAATSAPRCSKFAGPVFNVGATSQSTATPGATPAPAISAPASSGTNVTTSVPTPPALTTRLALKSPQKLSTVLAKGVSFRLRCNRACRVKGRLRLAGAGTRGLKRNQTMGTVSTRLSKAGVKAIRIKLTRKVRAALRRKRVVKVKLTVVGTASSGKPKTITRTLTLRR